MARIRLLFLFLLAGAFSQVVQALMGREMLVVFYGNEISLGLFYGFWLLWIALGSLGAGRWASRVARPVSAFALLAAALPAAAAGGILLLRVCRRFIDVSPTQFVPLGQLALWSLIVTLPVGVLMGAVFPFVCRALGSEQYISKAYAADAVGGLAGGAAFTFLLVDRLPVFGALGAAAALLGFALLMLPEEGGAAWTRTRRGLGALWAAAGLLVLLSPLGARLTAFADTLRWESILPKLELIETFNTPYQNLAIARLGAQTSVVADGKVAASFPARVVPAVEAALLYAQHPRARRVLLIEGAAGGLIPELLKYPVERIDCVEPDRKAFLRVRAHMPAAWRRAFNDKRVRIHFADPRPFVREQAGGKPYDLLVALVPDPATAHLNRFFTREFYAEARAVLAGDGLLVTKVSSASNYLGKEVKSYNASVYRTLREVFAEVRATPGDVNFFFASAAKGRLTLDPALLASRYMRVEVKGRSIPPQAFASILPADRVAFVENALRGAVAEVNTDLKPVTYYLNMLLWGRFSGSAWVGALETIRRVGGAFFLLPLGVFVLFRLGYGLTESDGEREARFGAGLILAAVGFTSMALNLTLLFTFQSVFGCVYRKVGLLNGLFMAGLAFGAAAASRLGANRTRRPGRWLMGAAALTAGFAGALPRLIEAARGAEGFYWGLVLFSGVLAGTAFPLAIRLYYRGLRDAARASGAMDSADHFGGMIGALITGTCLIPLLGVRTACRLAAAGLLMTCLPLILWELKKSRAFARLARCVSGHPALRLGERTFVSFPFKRTSWFLAALAVGIWAMTALVRRHAAPPILEFADAELAAVSGLARFQLREEPFKYYRGFKTGGEKEGASLSTFPHSAEVKGYSGPINLLLSLSEKGEVKGLKLIESRETPSYIEGIGAWLLRFKGLDSTAPIRLGRELDALSGATVTSRAVVEIVNRSSKSAGEAVLGLRFERSGASVSWTDSLKTPRFWVIALFLVLFFPVHLRGGALARKLYLAGAVGVMGFAYNTLLSLVDVANLSAGRLPGADNGVWYLLAGFFLLTSMLWGAVYCGAVCPFGALQELLWEAGRKMGLKIYADRWLDRRMRYVKFVILPAALCLYWLTGDSAWITFNPMQYFYALKFSGVMAILIVLVLGAAVLYFRFWCRYFCPSGALFALFNKAALARRWAPKRLFKLCDLGSQAEYDVDCIQCQRCVHHPAYERKINEN